MSERLDAKTAVLGEAARVCGPGTVFATTTSGQSVTEIASLCGTMTRTVGLHLFPAVPTTAVEVVRTPLTERPVQEAVVDLARRLGHTPVGVADRPGFIGGALAMAYLNSAATMYEQRYASREDIDTAMTLGCGLPMGPLAQLDVMGLDVARDTLELLYERTGDRAYAPAPLLSHYVAAGLLGRKAGRGFYDYGSGGATVASSAVGSPSAEGGPSTVRPSRPRRSAPPPPRAARPRAPCARWAWWGPGRWARASPRCARGPATPRCSSRAATPRPRGRCWRSSGPWNGRSAGGR
ncbi:3-hydroxyacyl-CoA dehydrogenase family protein [Streptomyces sp. MBT49]|uniref:3-hydroxyacyl-CoA dehydrogenase family protein n=1 Tax=Streptomyces sp. MBT49 TaxID=1488380 RepID=UPI0019099F81|nr:3-hydroxyacyl-CoA dehydrogenase family protein [Streptomyces sp. MBT49]MBK3630002.1 3-hydroxyacyl-CoA dehydrogenase family protein [Streptomyces sp. MBT49]